jgi:hypothetical protein
MGADAATFFDLDQAVVRAYVPPGTPAPSTTIGGVVPAATFVQMGGAGEPASLGSGFTVLATPTPTALMGAAGAAPPVTQPATTAGASVSAASARVTASDASASAP